MHTSATTDPQAATGPKSQTPSNLTTPKSEPQILNAAASKPQTERLPVPKSLNALTRKTPQPFAQSPKPQDSTAVDGHKRGLQFRPGTPGTLRQKLLRLNKKQRQHIYICMYVCMHIYRYLGALVLYYRFFFIVMLMLSSMFVFLFACIFLCSYICLSLCFLLVASSASSSSSASEGLQTNCDKTHRNREWKFIRRISRS